MQGRIRKKLNSLLLWLHWRKVGFTETFWSTIRMCEYPRIGVGKHECSCYTNLPARIFISTKEYPWLREQAYEYTLASLEHEMLHHILWREMGYAAFRGLDKINGYNMRCRELTWGIKTSKSI